MSRYGIFLVEFLFGFAILILLVRFYISGGPYESTSRLGVAARQLTNWLVKPLALFTPRLWGLEFAALLAAFLACFLQDILVYTMHGIKIFAQPQISLPVISVRSVLTLIIRSAQLYTAVLLAGVIVSLLQLRGPLVVGLSYYFARLLWPFRKVIRPVGGLDLSPLAALFAAQLVLFAASDALRTASAIFR